MISRPLLGSRVIGMARGGLSIRGLASDAKPKLTWVDYLALKRQNNIVNITAGVFTGLLGAAITLSYLGNIEIDLEKPIFGVDATLVMGGAVLMGGAFGFLIGPFLGTAIFNMRHKSTLAAYKAKDSVFLQRIKHYRVDPSLQSFSNPVPDYYGEKIYSLHDYKQWLRDCNAFRRKAKEFL